MMARQAQSSYPGAAGPKGPPYRWPGAAGPKGPALLLLRLRDVLHEDADPAGLDVDSLTDNRADAFVLHPTQLHLNELTFLVNRLQLDDGAGSADVVHDRPESTTVIRASDVQFVRPRITGGVTRLGVRMLRILDG